LFYTFPCDRWSNFDFLTSAGLKGLLSFLFIWKASQSISEVIFFFCLVMRALGVILFLPPLFFRHSFDLFKCPLFCLSPHMGDPYPFHFLFFLRGTFLKSTFYPFIPGLSLCFLAWGCRSRIAYPCSFRAFQGKPSTFFLPAVFSAMSADFFSPYGPLCLGFVCCPSGTTYSQSCVF